MLIKQKPQYIQDFTQLLNMQVAENSGMKQATNSYIKIIILPDKIFIN